MFHSVKLNETSAHVYRLLGIFKKIIFNTPRNICCGYLFKSPWRGNSNIYPQHMLLGVNKKKNSPLLHIILLYVGILNKYYRYSKGPLVVP